MKYDKNMDKECIELCDAINKIPGLVTIESCCGHGNSKFRIWFVVDIIEFLPILLYFCDSCHVGFDWNCIVTTDCGMSPVAFRIESEDMGEEAYYQSGVIAKEIISFMSGESFAGFEKELRKS